MAALVFLFHKCCKAKRDLRLNKMFFHVINFCSVQQQKKTVNWSASHLMCSYSYALNLWFMFVILLFSVVSMAILPVLCLPCEMKREVFKIHWRLFPSQGFKIVDSVQLFGSFVKIRSYIWDLNIVWNFCNMIFGRCHGMEIN